MTFRRPSLYLDAARRITPRQAVWRLRRVVPPALVAAGTAPVHSPDWTPLAQGLGVDPAPQSGPLEPPEETGAFAALGASRQFESPGFWRDRSDGLLFLFLLHGFAGLASYAAGPRSTAGDQFWAAVVASWLRSEAHPRYPAWHPYPTSLRVIAFGAALSSIDGWEHSLRVRLAAELARETRYLGRSIEHDIGGNHVLKNASALVIAGAVLGWTKQVDAGLALLDRELREQLLPDGGHYERSPSYHRLVAADLRDVAEVVARSGRRPPAWLSDAVATSACWEAAMRGPDGSLPLLNDSWDGPTGLADRSQPVTHLAESGYVVLRHRRDQAVFDVGPISPSHLPPHAHADVLSFVLWGDGRQVVADPGSYAYSGPWRNRFRCTAAHNTVEIDGKDQCAFWGDFRAAFLPEVRAAPPRLHSGAVVVMGMHHGYRRLPDPVDHHRALVWCPPDGLVVIDLLRAARHHAVRSSLHLAPGVKVNDAGAAGPFVVRALGAGAVVRRRKGSHSPHLGHKLETTVLVDERKVAPEVPFGWSLLRPGLHVADLDRGRLVLLSAGATERVIPLMWL